MLSSRWVACMPNQVGWSKFERRTSAAHSRVSGNPGPTALRSGSPLSRGRADHALSFACGRILSRARQGHVDAVVVHAHINGAQAVFGVAAVAAGFDVEFPAVPGADDVLLLGEAQAAAGLVRRQIFLDARDHLALADRAAVMGTIIFVREQPVALPENSELEALDPQHPVAAVGKVGQRADHNLAHRFTLT